MSNNGKKSQKKKGRFQVIPRTWYRTDPPPYNPQPWNKLTLEFNFTGLTPSNYGIITIANVVNTIRDQSGADVVTGAWWLFRFHGLAAWEMEGNPLEVVINDLDRLSTQTASDEDFQALRTLSDLPARNHWAHVCFVWPRDNRNNTYSNKDAATLNIATIKANNDEGTSKVRVYLKILWRTSNVNTPGRSVTFTGPDPAGSSSSPHTSAGKYTPATGAKARDAMPPGGGRQTAEDSAAQSLSRGTYAQPSTRSDKSRRQVSARSDRVYGEYTHHKQSSKNQTKMHKSCDTLPTNEEEAEMLYRRWDEELSDSE